MYLLLFILILVALIIVHEFGHFSIAKLFGIRVDEFGIGFPPRLLSIKYGETIYSINLLFFGGFVRIFGENKGDGGSNPRSFSNKSKWVQSGVIVAGITCNLLFAWLVLSLGFMVGMPTSVNHRGVGTVADAHTTIIAAIPDSPAAKAGLSGGDVVLEIETGTSKLPPNANSDDTQAFIAAHQDESMVITVMRDSETMSFVAKAEEGIISGRKAIGIQLDDVGILQLPPHLALLEGGLLAWNMTAGTAVGLSTFFVDIVRGAANFSDVAGPIGIASIGSQAIKHGFSAAITLTALISINLALINVLPIPGLDGGRLFLIALEGMRRKPISERLTFGLTLAGFAFLIGLMLVVSYHDITRLIG